jgi:hypothetical protein
VTPPLTPLALPRHRLPLVVIPSRTKILFVSSTIRIKRWVEKQGGYVPAGRPVSKILCVYSQSVQMACACKHGVQSI